MYGLDYYVIKRALNNDTFCGDAGIVKEFDNKVFIGILDVLGHGEEAGKVAKSCEDFLEKNYRQDLIKAMEGLHEHIKVSRGAVVCLAHLDLETGVMECVGMGNITIRKFGSSSIRLIPRSGIVGYIMSTIRKEEIRLYDGDILVFYTDGVKEHFDLEDYPELLVDDVKTIATHMIKRFGKEEDDACCIALRFRKIGRKK